MHLYSDVGYVYCFKRRAFIGRVLARARRDSAFDCTRGCRSMENERAVQIPPSVGGRSDTLAGDCAREYIKNKRGGAQRERRKIAKKMLQPHAHRERVVELENGFSRRMDFLNSVLPLKMQMLEALLSLGRRLAIGDWRFAPATVVPFILRNRFIDLIVCSFVSACVYIFCKLADRANLVAQKRTATLGLHGT